MMQIDGGDMLIFQFKTPEQETRQPDYLRQAQTIITSAISLMESKGASSEWIGQLNPKLLEAARAEARHLGYDIKLEKESAYLIHSPSSLLVPWREQLAPTTAAQVQWGVVTLNDIPIDSPIGKVSTTLKVIMGPPDFLVSYYPKFKDDEHQKPIPKQPGLIHPSRLKGMPEHYSLNLGYYFKAVKNAAAVISGTFMTVSVDDSAAYAFGLIKQNGKVLESFRRDAIKSKSDARHESMIKTGATSDWTSVLYWEPNGASIIPSTQASLETLKPYQNAIEVGNSLLSEGQPTFSTKLTFANLGSINKRMAVCVTWDNQIAFVKTAGEDMTREEFAVLLKAMGFRSAAMLDGSSVAQTAVRTADGQEVKDPINRENIHLFTFMNKPQVTAKR